MFFILYFHNKNTVIKYKLVSKLKLFKHLPLFATATAAHFPIPLLAPVIMKLFPVTSTSKSAGLKFRLAFK